MPKVIRRSAASHRISIDPGFQGTGWAIWPEQDWKPGSNVLPREVGILMTPNYMRNSDFTFRARWFAEELSKLCLRFNATDVYVEFPVFYDNAGGHMGMKTGDIPKLIFLVGVFSEVSRVNKAIFHAVMVPEWKGQVSKALVIHRLHKRFGAEGFKLLGASSHAYDAIGIGVWCRDRK